MHSKQPIDNRILPSLKSSFFWSGLLISLFSAALSFSYNYWLPDKMFWDENYHIASAYKYNKNVFFMEQHPPTGKLLIALAEKYSGNNQNLDTTNFLKVDHIKETPDGFNFRALRFPSVFFAILASVFFYLTFYQIFKNGLISCLTNTLYFLDNTIVVHSKSAMLEGPQIFAFSIAIFILTKIVLNNKIRLLDWLLLSIAFGFAISIKLNSAIMLIFFVYPYILEIKQSGFVKATIKASIPVFCAVLCLLTSYFIHFKLALNIVDNNDYEINKDYKEILENKSQSIKTFPIALKNMFEFIDRYNSGVPRLKEDSPKENGSHPIFWPVGKKSISYRWDKTSDGKVKHLKLQCNPIGWFIGLFSILTSLSLISANRIHKVKFEDSRAYQLLEILTLSYICYMLTMLKMGRVMYLYHYFVPLIFSFITAAILLRIKFYDHINSKFFISSILLFAFSQTITFFYFSPFTYHLPVSAKEFNDMTWFAIWRNELILW